MKMNKTNSALFLLVGLCAVGFAIGLKCYSAVELEGDEATRTYRMVTGDSPGAVLGDEFVCKAGYTHCVKAQCKDGGKYHTFKGCGQENTCDINLLMLSFKAKCSGEWECDLCTGDLCNGAVGGPAMLFSPIVAFLPLFTGVLATITIVALGSGDI